tara:strand:+ start:452 stop:988 length:537 start_codon:yes stop_codon:yes gene_type:complete
MSEGLFEVVLNKAQDFLKQKGIEIVSEKTLMAVLPLIIECVETVKNKDVTGEEKKALALRVLLFIVKESGIDDEKKDVLRRFIEEGPLETTIDIIVDASKGKFELNRKTKRKIFGCMSQCLETVGEYATRLPKKNEVVTDNSSSEASQEAEEQPFPEVFEDADETPIKNVKMTQSSMV